MSLKSTSEWLNTLVVNASDQFMISQRPLGKLITMMRQWCQCYSMNYTYSKL